MPAPDLVLQRSVVTTCLRPGDHQRPASLTSHQTQRSPSQPIAAVAQGAAQRGTRTDPSEPPAADTCRVSVPDRRTKVLRAAHVALGGDRVRAPRLSLDCHWKVMRYIAAQLGSRALRCPRSQSPRDFQSSSPRCTRT